MVQLLFIVPSTYSSHLRTFLSTDSKRDCWALVNWWCSVVSHKSAKSSNFPGSSVAKMRDFSPKDWNPQGAVESFRVLQILFNPLSWNSWVLPLLLPKSITELLWRQCPEWRAGLKWFSPAGSTAVWQGGCRQHGLPSLACWLTPAPDQSLQCWCWVKSTQLCLSGRLVPLLRVFVLGYTLLSQWVLLPWACKAWKVTCKLYLKLQQLVTLQASLYIQ